MTDRRSIEVLADEAVWAQPPAAIESGLMATITAEIAVQEERNGHKSNWWPAVAVAAAIFAIFLAVGPEPVEEPGGTPIVLAATDLADEATATGRAGPSAAGWWIRLEIEGLDPAPSDTYYEGWLTDGDEVVSVGTFHMRDGSSVVLWSGVPMDEFPQIQVTRQNLGGSLTPSDVVVLEGHLASGG